MVICYGEGEGVVMVTWNGWTDKERNTSARKTNRAIKDGIIPAKPSKCNRCGQTEGVLEWHNDDYSDPIKYLEGLCYRCHMVLHCEHLNPQSAKEYWDEVGKGKRYPPSVTKNIGAVMSEHRFRQKRQPSDIVNP
jgi:hypothetical protein